ncbi:MAG: hypothetical protein FWF12_03945 [Betaproteobacteria bacterium]|nr:hypothetical protein [Betaproteobacteria bacterium]
MSLEQKHRQPAKCVIKIDGKETVDLYPYLEQVSVETSRNSAAVCTLTFASVREKDGKWNVQDLGLLEPWKRLFIEVDFGAGEEEIMRGFIRDIKIEYPEDMIAKVVVTGQDETILLDRQHVQKVFSTLDDPLQDDDLIRELLKDYWVGNDVNAAKGTTCGNLYFDGTPIRLIRDRAALNRFEFYIRKGKAYFGLPDLNGTPQPVILIYAGQASNCFNFSIIHDGHLPDSVRFTDMAEDDGKPFSITYSGEFKPLGEKRATSEDKGLGDFTWRLRSPRGSTQDERKARAKAKAEEVAWKIRATGELDGSMYGHVLQTNSLVKVDGVGSTYGGLWYVDEVKHHFSTDGYRQAFQLIRNATIDTDSKDMPDPLAKVRKI